MKQRKIIGWREWVQLPDLGIDWIKAKVDTGAKTSSIHAFNIKKFTVDGEEYVRFDIHPVQRSKKPSITVEAKVMEYRKIRSSNGQQDLRPVIKTSLGMLGAQWEIELTLANRDDMGFRMLLGREGFRKYMLVDANRSYLGPRPPRQKRKVDTKKKGDTL